MPKQEAFYVEAVKKLREQMRLYWETLKTPEDRSRFLNDMATKVGVNASDVLTWMESDRIYTMTDLKQVKNQQQQRPQ